MEDSILKSTKKMLGLEDDYTAFDLDVITHINSALASLNQLGIGDATPIEDDKRSWSDLSLPSPRLSMAKTYVFKKVRLAFDPPQTSYLIEAIKDEIHELEWRLNTFAESDRILPEREEVEL